MEIIISVILLFVGIAVLVVIHVCIVVRAFGIGHDAVHNMAPRSSRSNRTTTKMSNENLKILPCFEYNATEREGTSPVDCIVCLENFKVGDNCRLLPNCNHTFHTQCIDSWLLKAPICPICRSSIYPPEIGVTLSQESGSSVDVVLN